MSQRADSIMNPSNQPDKSRTIIERLCESRQQDIPGLSSDFKSSTCKDSGPCPCNCPYCQPEYYVEARNYKKQRPEHYEATIGPDQFGAKLRIRGSEKTEIMNLAVTAIENFDVADDDLSTLQRTAKEEWRDWYRGDALQLGSYDLEPEKIVHLEKAYDIFGNFFFSGRLHSDVFLEFMERYKDPKRAGFSRWRRTGRWKGIQRIEIYPMSSPSHPGFRGEYYLGTLLHEMVHAFLAQNSCKAKQAEHSVGCKQLQDVNRGSLGHGRAFQWLARAIEEVAGRQLGLYVEVGDTSSLDREIRDSHIHPSAHDLWFCFPGVQCRRNWPPDIPMAQAADDEGSASGDGSEGTPFRTESDDELDVSIAARSLLARGRFVDQPADSACT